MEGQFKKWAILIGVDCYMEDDRRRDKFSSLSGCVQDIRRVERYIHEFHQIHQSRIKILTASTPSTNGSNDPPEDKALWPTHENINAAIRDVTSQAQRDDLVYIHYSGHGTRVETVYPERKGLDGLDEALVPLDRNIGGRYLRDIEFADCLAAMVEKGLNVTVVLDCCHSGSATRGTHEAQIRGSRQVDKNVFPGDVPLVKLQSQNPEAEQVSTPQPPGDRTNWLAGRRGYTLLAACRPHEVAWESYIDGSMQGLLTHHLIKVLSKLGRDSVPISHQRLYQMICATITTTTKDYEGGGQNPMLIGTGYSSFFGIQKMLPSDTAYVLSVESQRKACLNVGRAHGVFVGAEYSISSLETSISPQQGAESTECAHATVVSVGGLESGIEFKRAPSIAIEIGCQATLVSQVQLRNRYVNLPESVALGAKQKEALDELRHDWMRLTAGGISLILKPSSDDDDDDDDDENISYDVAINADNDYIVTATKETLRAEIPKVQNLSNHSLIACMRHLAKFSAYEQLENVHPHSGLRDRFVFRLLEKEIDSMNGDYFVKEDEPFRIEFRNNCRQDVLNLTIFDMTPRRAIEKIWPESSDYDTVDAGRSEIIPLATSIPVSMKAKGAKACRDILLAVVTTKPRSFKMLEMPKLSDALSQNTRTAHSRKSLEEFFEILSPRREVRSLSGALQEWQTAKVSVVTTI